MTYVFDRSQTTKDLAAYIVSKHKPELALEHGHVSHLYSDGEHTSQKCGDLYGMRSEHCLAAGCASDRLSRLLEAMMPPNQSHSHKYIICSYEDAVECLELIKQEQLRLNLGRTRHALSVRTNDACILARQIHKLTELLETLNQMNREDLKALRKGELPTE